MSDRVDQLIRAYERHHRTAIFLRDVRGKSPDAIRARYAADVKASAEEAGCPELEAETLASVVLRAVDDALSGRPPSPLWGDLIPLRETIGAAP